MSQNEDNQSFENEPAGQMDPLEESYQINTCDPKVEEPEPMPNVPTLGDVDRAQDSEDDLLAAAAAIRSQINSDEDLQDATVPADLFDEDKSEVVPSNHNPFAPVDGSAEASDQEGDEPNELDSAEIWKQDSLPVTRQEDEQKYEAPLESHPVGVPVPLPRLNEYEVDLLSENVAPESEHEDSQSEEKEEIAEQDHDEESEKSEGEPTSEMEKVMYDTVRGSKEELAIKEIRQSEKAREEKQSKAEASMKGGVLFRPISSTSIASKYTDKMTATAQTEVAWVSAAIGDNEIQQSLSPERSDLPKAIKKKVRVISPSPEGDQAKTKDPVTLKQQVNRPPLGRAAALRKQKQIIQAEEATNKYKRQVPQVNLSVYNQGMREVFQDNLAVLDGSFFTLGERVTKNVEMTMIEMIEDGVRVVEVDKQTDISKIIKKNESSFQTARQKLDEKVNSQNYQMKEQSHPARVAQSAAQQIISKNKGLLGVGARGRSLNQIRRQQFSGAQLDINADLAGMGSPVKKQAPEPVTKQALKLIRDQNAKSEAGQKDIQHLRTSVQKVEGTLQHEMKHWQAKPAELDKQLKKIAEPIRFGDEQYEEARAKQKDSLDLVKRLKIEKREREKKMKARQDNEENKLALELERRQHQHEAKEKAKQAELDAKRMDIENKVKQRVQARQQSQAEMIERTKQIASAKNRVYRDREFQFNEEAADHQNNQIAEKVRQIRQTSNAAKEGIKEHAAKYEQIMKEKKDALREKRSLVGRSEDETSAGSRSKPLSFKSRLHSDVRDQAREVRNKAMVDLEEKQQRAERKKSYARNVKEMYMPKLSARNERSLPDLHAHNASDQEGGGNYSALGQEEMKPPRRLKELAKSENGGIASKEIRMKKRRVEEAGAGLNGVQASGIGLPPKPKKKPRQNADIGQFKVDNTNADYQEMDYSVGNAQVAQLPRAPQQQQPTNNPWGNEPQQQYENPVYNQQPLSQAPTYNYPSQDFQQEYTGQQEYSQLPVQQHQASSEALPHYSQMQQQPTPQVYEQPQQHSMGAGPAEDTGDVFVDNIRAKLDMLEQM